MFSVRFYAELTRLYHRYIALRTECRFVDIPLRRGGDLVGYVEECVYARDRLRLRGWALSHRLVLEAGEVRHPLPRRIHRGDVAMAMGAKMLSTGNQHGRVGFDLVLPWSNGTARLVADDIAGAGVWHLPVPDSGMIRAQRNRSRLRFLRDMLFATPAGLRYLLGGRRREDRERLRTLMGLGDAPAAGLLLDPGFLEPVEEQEHGFSGVTIIMPVYNAFDLLTESLDRVDRHTDVPWHLVVIEDDSSDPRVRPWLRDWAAARTDRVTLLLNEQNLGFIGSVNRALAVAARRGGPVILLNSDALVPQGWASRLLRPLLEDDRIASVTPMSNDATILTVPWIAGRVALQAGAVDRIDAVALCLSSQARAHIPTGVGFCMAMSRAALDQVPALDPVFGRGYGEEVDWCRKTAATGMIHLGIGNLFVEHRGGGSFGDAAKARALESSAKIISARYPEFDSEVGHFISSDPLMTTRLILALAWAADKDPDPIHVYLGHSLGGGAEHWLAARIAERTRQDRPTIVIRVGGTRRFSIELHDSGGVLAGQTDEIDLVRNLILTVPRRRVLYSCGVGDERPWELPSLLCDLSADEGSTLEILFHDYFPISPSLNLLNADGRYTGIPPADSTDSAHQIASPDGQVGLLSWRAQWQAAVRQAEQLTVFSNSSSKIVLAVWPEARSKIACLPHEVLFEMPPLAPVKNGGAGTLGILGAIGAVKGAQLVSDLAYYLDLQPKAPRLVIVGEFDHSFALPPSVKVTGRYEPATLPKVLSSYGITAWLMPSVWPETFSFTTREMLATGLPVMAFDLGAQGEAVREAANGYIVAPDPTAIYECYRRLCGEK